MGRSVCCCGGSEHAVHVPSRVHATQDEAEEATEVWS